MNRILFLLACVLRSAVGSPAAENPRPPNVLFIMTDQQRWDCLGANGNALIKTPALTASPRVRRTSRTPMCRRPSVSCRA